MNFSPSLYKKGFYKFTGTPENWLTAIKFMTWGLTEDHMNQWAKIQPGDVFFMHSTAGSSNFKNAKPTIIGIGVVASNFTVKDNYLWIDEFLERKNKWPLLIPFSEIYLFSDIPEREKWEAPSINNLSNISHLIDQLLSKAVPLSSIYGFPQMGSFSSVKEEVARQILNILSNLHTISASENLVETKGTRFIPINNASESMRYAQTLQIFDEVKAKIVTKEKSVYEKDNELLARAEDSHAATLQSLIDFFKSKNYTTYQNKHVDLFAIREDKSYLLEVKSTDNNNFRTQARKGLVQLFEYEYFEVKKFLEDEKIKKNINYRVLVSSQKPQDDNYISFINSLNTNVGYVENLILQSVGSPEGIQQI